jgi:hypothetical protein
MSSFEQKPGQAPAPAPAPPQIPSQPSVATNNSNYRLPSDITFQHAGKLAIVDDKPILLDYWTDSLDKKVIIGIRETRDPNTSEKLLVKSAEEYTSPIAKFYKSGAEYIIITENSIYIVSSEIANKRIS